MYDKDIKTPIRCANSTKAFVESAINLYENSNKSTKNKKYTTRYHEEADMLLESSLQKGEKMSRYHSFVESVKNSLVVETIYKIFKESVSEEIQKDHVSTSIMRSIVNQYVTENGYSNILNRMRTGSTTLSTLYNIVTEMSKSILESTDKEDTSTFSIAPEMKDEFFRQLDYSDSEAISDAIRSRVSDAMNDFITANTNDHEDITLALKQAQEKIEANPDSDDSVNEFYEMFAKQKISKIRNAPKSVFHTMVTTMCETVMKNKDTYAEFLNENNHLDIDKIVKRVSLMYTFMEMLNTSRIDIVDEVFIENVIKDLKK